MDISFILSRDEVYTLMSLFDGRTDAGARFAETMLGGAGECDLSGLADKKLATVTEGGLVLSPLIRMIADSLNKADGVTADGEACVVTSRWVSLRCEAYPYKERHLKITPMHRQDESRTGMLGRAACEASDQPRTKC